MRQLQTLALVIVVCGVATGAQTQRPPTNTSPSVSPDGRSIVFVSTRTGNPDLFVIGTDGTGERALTATPEAESKPHWSADGRRLLYGVGSGQTSEIREVDLATGTTRVIGSVPSRGLTVSPSATLVAYTSGPWQTSHLAVARVDGSNEKILTTAEQTPIAWNPVFSPDEQWVAFTGQDRASNLQIFVVSLSTGRVQPLTQVTAAQGRAQVPSFSMDGARVAFQVNRQGTSDIWLAPRDGSRAPEAVVIANAAELNEAPSWFPDGRTLAFQSNRSGSMEIWVIGLDGTPPRQLTGLRAR